jgi:hypothetical protein
MAAVGAFYFFGGMAGRVGAVREPPSYFHRKDAKSAKVVKVLISE